MAKLHKLPSGLEVLLEENHAAPVISYHLLVKVGSAMEGECEAGISHVIEHMLFKGTPTRKVGEIAKEVEAAGGEINAYTSFDQTVYFINMASRFSDKGLSILGDAIQNPLFDKEELEKEKEVILEEIRRETDNPSHRNSELLFLNAFKKHPYKNPIIGTTKTVKSFSRADLLSYYKRWYTPDNMTLVVVGDFKPEKILGKIKKTFCSFKGKMAKVQTIPDDGKPGGLRVVTEGNPIFASYFSLGFIIPEIVHKDVPALDLLSHILAGSDSSRLEQVIKEKKQLVNEVYSYAFTPKHPGLFIVGGLTTPDKTGKAIRSIWDEIDKLKYGPVKNSELSRAKLNILSGEIYEKETTTGQAGKYAYFMATAGDHDFDKKYYPAIQAVNADDISEAAKKYLTKSNTTLVIVHPNGCKEIVDAAGTKKHLVKDQRQPKTGKIPDKGTPTLISHKLSNGIRMLISENHTLPIIACTAVVHGGLRYESAATNGINNLLARTIIKGTKNRSAVEIAEKIESIAGSIGGFSGRNSFGIKTEFLGDKFDDGFSLFAEVLTQPSFEASEIKKEKLQILDAIKNQEDSLTSMTFIKFLEALFPSHPYGLRSLGTKKTVRGFDQNDLAKYYKKILDPSDVVISVVGDVSPDDVIKYAEQKIVLGAKIKKGSLKLSPQRMHNKPITVEYKRPGKEQAHIVIGFVGPTLSSKDRYPFAVLNNILSGQGGRLFLNLRDRMSLAYAISSTFFAGIEPGFFAVYIGTEPSKTKTAIDGMMGELDHLVKKGVSASELSQSKNHIIGTFEMEKQRYAAMADSYAFNILYGLGIKEIEEYPKRIDSVTKEDLLRVSRKYLRLDAPVTSIIKPE